MNENSIRIKFHSYPFNCVIIKPIDYYLQKNIRLNNCRLDAIMYYTKQKSSKQKCHDRLISINYHLQ